jgi:hypothetical protein
VGADARRLYRNTPADTQMPYLEDFSRIPRHDRRAFIYAEGLAMGPDAEQKALAIGAVADRGSPGRLIAARESDRLQQEQVT